jgi:hypothetical protein
MGVTLETFAPPGWRRCDQLGMYATFGKKRTWLFPQDVDANKADEVTLTYGE